MEQDRIAEILTKLNEIEVAISRIEDVLLTRKSAKPRTQRKQISDDALPFVKLIQDHMMELSGKTLKPQQVYEILVGGVGNNSNLTSIGKAVRILGINRKVTKTGAFYTFG